MSNNSTVLQQSRVVQLCAKRAALLQDEQERLLNDLIRMKNQSIFLYLETPDNIHGFKIAVICKCIANFHIITKI